MLRIRGIKREDAEKYRGLCVVLDRETEYRLYEPGERPYDIEGYIEEIERFRANPTSKIFVVEDKDTGDLVGYLQAKGHSQRRVRHAVSIHVAILRQYTGKGLGGKLLGALEDWARRQGVSRLDLCVMENNPHAIKLYEKLGYRREGIKRRSMCIDGVYINEIYMSKWLDSGQVFFEIAHTMEEQKGVLFTEGLCAARRAGEEIFYHAIGCDYESQFDLASITKVLTSTIILRLVGEGRFMLDMHLDDVLRKAPMGETTRRRFRNITVKDLLVHASGLPAWYPFYIESGGFWDVLEKVLQKYPDNGRKTEYSDINYMLLGELIRIKTEKSLQENLASLNAKLGTNFSYLPANPLRCVPTEYGNRVEMGEVHDRGFGYVGWRDTTKRIRGKVHDGNCYYFWNSMSGHAGIFGGAEDVLRLGELYLQGGEDIIPGRLIAESLRDYGAGRGLGWDLTEVFAPGAGHTGFTGTAMWICPEKNAVAALLCSRLALDGPPNLQPLRREIFSAFYETL